LGNGKEPVPMTKETMYGKFFFSLQEKQLVKVTDLPRVFTASLKVVVSEKLYLREGIFMTADSMKCFNHFVKEHIYELMFANFDFVEEYGMQKRMKIIRAIQVFCDIHGLNEQIFSYERAKKAYYRRRIAINTLKAS
jgi:hypothetical protein